MSKSKKVDFYKSTLFENGDVVHGFSPYDALQKRKPLDLSAQSSERKVFLEELQVSSQEVCEVKQVHGGVVKILKSKKDVQGFRKIECDGIVTQEPGVVLAIRTADCIPLLFFDAQTKTIAAVHGGWRSCAQKIVQNAVSIMKELGVQTKNLKVVLGPGICHRCFEVGPDVIIKFERDFYTRKNEDKFLMDLYEAHKAQLISCGILPSHIERLRYCTFHQENLFFSYRRDKTEKRHLNFIGLR